MFVYVWYTMSSVFFQRIFMQRIEPRTSELRILNARIKFIWTASKTCPFEFQPLKWQTESNDYIKTRTSYVFVETKPTEKKSKTFRCHCSVIFKISFESFRYKNLFFIRCNQGQTFQLDYPRWYILLLLLFLRFGT